MQGFGTGGGLIVAIGAQNAFVLSQGVRGNHHVTIALICILCDTVFITAGVAGFGSAVAANPFAIAVGGVGRGRIPFLLWLGARFVPPCGAGVSIRTKERQNL